MLISNQEYAFNTILEMFSKSSNRFCLLKGDSGTGKTFVIQLVADFLSKKNIFIYSLYGDRYSLNRDFYPFKNFFTSQFSERKKYLRMAIPNISSDLATDATKSIPVVGELISALTRESINLKNEVTNIKYSIFDEEEKDILQKLEYLEDDKESLFIIEDLQYWDTPSVNFIYQLVKNTVTCDFMPKSKFLISINPSSDINNMNSTKKLFEFFFTQQITLNTISRDEFTSVFKIFITNFKPSEHLIDAIYSLCKGHLQLAKELAITIDGHNEDDLSYILEKDKVKQFIEERLYALGAEGKTIDEMLKYASIFGISFKYREIQYVLNINEIKVRQMIKQANKLYLVNSTSEGAIFVHEIIRELFLKKTEMDIIGYYSAYSDAIKILYPGNYLLRGESLLKAGLLQDAGEMFLLQKIKNVRTGKSVDILTEKYISIVDSLGIHDYENNLIEAYKFYDLEKYDKCLICLESIEDINRPSLLAEKYYLMSISYSKYLDNENRRKAIVCLLPYIDSINYEFEIWQRLCSALLVAYIHSNMIDSAKRIEKKLMYELSKRIDYDIDSLIDLNILRRKSSSIHFPKTAFQFIKKSVEFFGPRNFDTNGLHPFDIKEYYMSLTNYVAMSLTTGNFIEGYQKSLALINLPNRHKDIHFQRLQMPMNNYILISYFSNQLSLSQSLHHMQELAKNKIMQDVDKIVIEANLAIFFALSEKLDASKEILTKLKNKIERHKFLESFYHNLIQSNYASLIYLMNQREEALHIIKDLLEYTRKYCINDGYTIKRTSAIYQTMLDNISYPNALSWFNDAIAIYSENDNSWRYFGKGFIFGELEFWSES